MKQFKKEGNINTDIKVQEKRKNKKRVKELPKVAKKI